MSVFEKMIEKSFEQSLKVAVKTGAEMSRQAFASEAGKALRGGNGGVMQVFNALGRVLKKF